MVKKELIELSDIEVKKAELITILASIYSKYKEINK